MSDRSVLKIEKSIMQSRWVFPPVNDDLVDRLMKDHSLHEIVARLLVSRNVESAGVETYLNPKLARDFPDPFSLQGMQDFADFMADAIIAGRKIAAFCDFDVDGSTSAAVLKKFFRHLGQEITIYIPDRMSEGYGPNARALHTLKQGGADIVIMADCGTTAFEVIAQGRELGLDICVLDHHEAEDKLPNANHVINPKRKDDTSGLDMLAAVGVTFLSCVAINTALRNKNFYTSGRTEPQLKNWLDLVGLGTVCDMVPLTGANRLLVKAGFAQMAKHNNIGLKALGDVANMKKMPTPDDAGFILGPRINAGSRVHQSDLGAKLLASEDPEEAKNLAWLLNDCNNKRKTIQADMMRDAVGRVELHGFHEHPIIFVHDESWHVGLNGLVAGQLKEKYGKPACVIAYAPGMDGQLEGRGSGRSVAGFNLAALFGRAREAGLVIKGGGHAMAAGFTVLKDKVDELHHFLREEAAKVIEQGIELISEEPVDGVATIRGLRPEFVRLLEDNVGPFGMANPEPKFVLPYVKIINADIVGESHVRLLIADIEGGTRMKAMAFRAVDTPLGDALLGNRGKQAIHLMGQFHVNSWNGMESVEFHIGDASYPTGIAE